MKFLQRKYRVKMALWCIHCSVIIVCLSSCDTSKEANDEISEVLDTTPHTATTAQIDIDYAHNVSRTSAIADTNVIDTVLVDATVMTYTEMLKVFEGIARGDLPDISALETLLTSLDDPSQLFPYIHDAISNMLLDQSHYETLIWLCTNAVQYTRCAENANTFLHMAAASAENSFQRSDTTEQQELYFNLSIQLYQKIVDRAYKGIADADAANSAFFIYLLSVNNPSFGNQEQAKAALHAFIELNERSGNISNVEFGKIRAALRYSDDRAHAVAQLQEILDTNPETKHRDFILDEIRILQLPQKSEEERRQEIYEILQQLEAENKLQP